MSSPRFATGPLRTMPESTTSAFSTTSYDSRSEEGRGRDRTHSNVDRDARDRTYSNADRRDKSYSDKDTTRDSYSHSHRDVTFTSRKDVTYLSGGGDTSTDTERHGSYDFHYPQYEKTECSCDEAGGCQKLSFLFLIITFLGHSIAVCTPYWVVGYLGGQMTIYEGVWLSCYRERGVGSWVCSTYDTIRGLFEQPVWYQAAQVCAVLSVILLIPALIVGSLYSYVVALRGRSRASYVFVAFTASAAVCSFLSWVIYAAGYPTDQDFPPGSVRFHISFALQIISFLFCVLTIATHLRDSYPSLTVWDNRMCAGSGLPSAPNCGPPIASCTGRSIELPKTQAASKAPKVAITKPSRAPKLPSFSMPKFPSALSRFRSTPSAPPAPIVDTPDRRDEREPTAERLQTLQVPSSGAPSQRTGTSYKAYNASSDSMSGYDSQV